MIPKIIHSVWVGKAKKPKLVRDCEKSWRKYCCDYKFIEWNESNFDINLAPLFVKEAYKMKKWAFVSDYIRLWALYNYGGIYLDSDMELLKNIDVFLKNKSFSGFEDDNSIQSSIIGSVKKNTLIKELLDYYNDKKFIQENGLNTITNVQIISKILSKKGLVRNNKEQLINNNLKIYPSVYFCPKSFKTGEVSLENNSYGIHHFNMSWLSLQKKISIKLGRIYKRYFFKKTCLKILLKFYPLI